ncbi:MAG: hypothetical protein JWN86_883 [Planctomycetota bacterium]|nr:hypothetical protein [Planctomycetota bacterium]
MARPRQFTIRAGMLAVAFIGIACSIISPYLIPALLWLLGVMLTPFLLVAIGLIFVQVVFPFSLGKASTNKDSRPMGRDEL